MKKIKSAFLSLLIGIGSCNGQILNFHFKTAEPREISISYSPHIKLSPITIKKVNETSQSVSVNLDGLQDVEMRYSLVSTGDSKIYCGLEKGKSYSFETNEGGELALSDKNTACAWQVEVFKLLNKFKYNNKPYYNLGLEDFKPGFSLLSDKLDSLMKKSSDVLNPHDLSTVEKYASHLISALILNFYYSKYDDIHSRRPQDVNFYEKAISGFDIQAKDMYGANQNTMLALMHYFQLNEKHAIDSLRKTIPKENQDAMLTAIYGLIENKNNLPKEAREFLHANLLMNLINKKSNILFQTLFDRYKATYDQSLFLDGILSQYARFQNQYGTSLGNIVVEGTGGEKSSLGELLGGKLTYVDFWATWCGPCIKQMPYLDSLYMKYKDSPEINIVRLSVDKDTSKWRKHESKQPVPFISKLLPQASYEELQRKLTMNGIPLYVILDQNGKIIDPKAYSPSDPKLVSQLEKLTQPRKP